MISKLKFLAATAAASAPSASPLATASAPAAVDAVIITSAPGIFFAMYSRHCASACGCVANLLISEIFTPGLTINAKLTAKILSPIIKSGSPLASSSKVLATTPSTEFSIGTIA